MDEHDKYHCIKIPLDKILYHDCSTDKILHIINDAVMRTNYITTKSYFLLRLWILENYHSNIDIPIITEDTIKMSMKSVMKPSAGPKPKGNNLLLLQEFQKLHSFTLEDGVNLSGILNYYTTTMITAIENNIKMHFMDYINRFINSYFKNLYKEELQNKEFKKQLYKELKIVKNDIIFNTLNSNIKYHNWINENKNKIVPENYDNYDIKANPQKYFKYMIFMNLELEKIEGKMFQFFPLQTQIIPRHIQIDTKALIELLVIENKKPFLDNIELYKDFLWNEYFDIKVSLRKYDFDYTIITDGYATSLRFIHKDCVEEQKIKIEKMRKGRNKLKGLTIEEKEKIKLEKEKKIKEEKNKLEIEKKSLPKVKIIKEEEFPYIDEIPKEELIGKHIYIDPGKRSLLTMMDDKGQFLFYTNKQRIKETKRLKYQSLLKNYKDKMKITCKENELSIYNSKTCNLDKFKKYIEEKLKVNQDLYLLYQNEKFRQYKWYSYINKKRTEDNMLNKIEKKYSKDHTIIIGDWSIGKQMRNFISTPNLAIKRKLQTRFKVYNIDEFRTSCLNHITEEHCKNLYLPDKKGKDRKMHSILTFKMENKRNGCINRDKNGCKNIKKVFESYMKTGERPEKYKREYTLK